jgi:hypothetical protein
MRGVTMITIFFLLIIATSVGWQDVIGFEDIKMASLGRHERWGCEEPRWQLEKEVIKTCSDEVEENA